MRNLLFFLTALVLSACNLTAPGSPVEPGTTTPGPLSIQPTSDLPTPNYPTPAAAQTDWVTYTNTQNGYTIQRPRSVSLVEEQNGDIVYIDDQIEITVSDNNPEEGQGGGMPVIEEASDMMLWTYPARRRTGYIGSIGGNTPQTIEQVIVPHNNRFYVFTIYELKRRDWTGDISRTMTAIDPSQMELFNSILTTLRFEN